MAAKKIRHFLLELFAWFLALIVLVPIFIVIINSFKTQSESFTMSISLPKQFQFENYATVIKEGGMVNAFTNSLIITVFSVFITNFSAALGSFIMARRKTRVTKLFYLFFIIGLLAPINYIPTIRIMQFLHIMNTFPGIILLYSALMLPFTIFLFYGFVNTVPRDLDEVAILDGCSSWQLFLKIQLPLMRPVMVTGVLINFMNAWNDFILPLYFFNRSSTNPITLAVYNFYGTYIASWNLVCAAIIITVLPILIVYILGQKYIVSGMVAGAIKG